MAAHATVPVTSQTAWTPLNAGSAAAGSVSLYNVGGEEAWILVSTSSSAPTLNDTTVGQSFRLRAGDAILAQTLADLAPGLTSPQYLYARSTGTRLLVSCA